LSELYKTIEISNYSEGYAKVGGFWIFYKTFGEGKNGTMLCLHGGPGGAHDSSVPMARLTKNGYKIVLYDQLGCGKSQQPKNESLYTVETYVEEVEGIRQALNLGRIHLYGHSWGGFLNVAYALKYSQNLESLLVSSGSSSTPLCISEMYRLRSELPKEIQDTLAKFESRGDYLNREYLAAIEAVYKRHLCRLDPWPPMVQMLVDAMNKGPGLVYNLMWGPNEFLPLGNLKYWDVTRELHKITTPTLITHGRYDEVTPKNGEVLNQGIKDSKFVIFEQSSHSARLEEPEKYFETYLDFIQSVK
jgi:proline iminopeptidase